MKLISNLKIEIAFHLLYHQYFHALLAFSAGILLPFAFAPFGIYPLAIVAVALLLFSWLNATPKQAFLYGWLFGLGSFGIGVSWIYISLHDYGFMSPILAAIITALFIAAIASFPALQGYVLTKFFPQNNWHKLLLAAPAIFSLSEWIRSWIFTGFTWLFLGYSQIDSPLRSIAPIFGVYGISFAIVFTAGCIICLWQTRKMTEPKKTRQRLLLILAIILLWGTSAKFAAINWTQPAVTNSQPIKVSLIQGNVSQEIKWQAKKLPHILQTHLNLTQKHWDSQIIVWPEAAIPTTSKNVSGFLRLLNKTAKKHQTTLITGLPLVRTDKNKNQLLYNAIISVGVNHGTYLKRHLVPFGEYTPDPFKPLLSYLPTFFAIIMSSFNHGPAIQPPLIAANIRIAPSICYEITYPNLVLDYLPQAQLLLTVSDDSWFGKSAAAEQQLEMTRMRSLETGRYQLVNTNTGITAIIDGHGKIITRAPMFKTLAIRGEITALEGKTPWVDYGYILWGMMSALCLIFAKLLTRFLDKK